MCCGIILDDAPEYVLLPITVGYTED